MCETSSMYAGSGQDFQAAEAVVRYLREQRHDFMNHIQVIWGFLQLGRADKSVKYIKDMNRKLDVLGKALRLNNPIVSLFFYEKILDANECGMDVDIEMEEIDINRYFADEIKVRISVLKQAIDEIIKISSNRSSGKEIYIDLFEEEEILHIEISNNRDLIIDGDNMYNDGIIKNTEDANNGISVIYSTGNNNDCQVNICLDSRGKPI